MKTTKRFLISLFAVSAVIAGPPDTAVADSGQLEACHTSGIPVVRIAAPHRYRADLEGTTPAEIGAIETTSGSMICPAYAYGNDYQVLDWLENGRVDAAIMSQFSAAVLDAAQPDDSGNAFYHVAERWPFGTGDFYRYQIRLSMTSNSGPSESRNMFNDMLERIARASSEQRESIVLDSHLSMAFPVLMSYVEDQLEIAVNVPQNQREEFWERFLHSLEFRISQESVTGPHIAATVHAAMSPTDRGFSLAGPDRKFSDVFVFDARLSGKFFGSNIRVDPSTFRSTGVQYWLIGEDGDFRSSIEDAFSTYLDRNFSIHEAGFRKQRHFRFNLDEIWRATHEMEFDSSALVLTGGGVKAAYQTRLIDHLYGHGSLTNSNDDSSDQSLTVDHVIGTSGGALLGIFVSAIEESEELNLTGRLWERSDADGYIDSNDIFPFLDMLRYMTVLVAGFVFAVILFTFRILQKLWAVIRNHDTPDAVATADRSHSRAPIRLIWVALMGIAPIVAKIVIGEAGLEHVPALAGVAFLFCMLIASYSDNRLVYMSDFDFRSISVEGREFVILVIAFILVAMSLIFAKTPNPTEFNWPVFGFFTTATVLWGAGFVLLCLAFHLSLAKARTGLKKVKLGDLLSGFFVLISVPVFAYLALLATKTTLFELNPLFWRRYVFFSALVSIVVILLAYLPVLDVRYNVFRRGMAFLVAPPAARTALSDSKRYSRVMMFYILSFLWWNLVVAPGVYGNDTAIEYFETLYAAELCDGCGRDDLGRTAIKPQTDFVISATSLEKNEERYFVLQPSAFAPTCKEGIETGDDVVTRLLKTDPRWRTMACEPRAAGVIKTAFASGSPFPIFPATNVDIFDPIATVNGTKEVKEWLVDGGYAHNIPIEAADALGADAILVISSSPLHVEHVQTRSFQDRLLGGLALNIPRLLPYLFERSQVEDAVRAEEAFVVTLSPIGPDPRAVAEGEAEAWPPLTDFRSTTVKRMITEAERDLSRRIGMIESWGPPLCRLRGDSYLCESLAETRMYGDP